SAVQRKAKNAWLALMADDVCIEDPIGVSPLDPVGKGHCGKAALDAFWDRNIAPTVIRIEPHHSFAAGKESAHLLTLETSFPNGARTTVTGIFTYRVNDAGKLVSLRGYWQLKDARIDPPPAATPG
ncbi:MAG: nuclear transport factor 2 family protein, partial [Myxococcota bacterium]